MAPNNAPQRTRSAVAELGGVGRCSRTMKAALLFLAILASVLSLGASAGSFEEPQFLRRHQAVITALDNAKLLASFKVTPKNTTKYKEPFILTDFPLDPDHLTVSIRYGRGSPHPASIADLHVGARIELTASITISGGMQVAEIVLLKDHK